MNKRQRRAAAARDRSLVTAERLRWSMQHPSTDPLWHQPVHNPTLHLFQPISSPCLDARTSRFAPMKVRNYSQKMRLSCAKEANEGNPDVTLKLQVSTSFGRRFEKMDNDTGKYVDYVLETAMRRGEGRDKYGNPPLAPIAKRSGATRITWRKL